MRDESRLRAVCFPAVRIVDLPVLPLIVACVLKPQHELESHERILAMGGIRVFGVELRGTRRTFFRSRRISGFFQPDNLPAKVITALEDLDLGIFVLIEPDAEDIGTGGRDRGSKGEAYDYRKRGNSIPLHKEGPLLDH